jgi:protein tyrosine phosphatase
MIKYDILNIINHKGGINMADLINIRLTKDSPEVKDMDEFAKAMGISRNEMILKAIKLMIGLDKVFYRKMESYSKKVKVLMHTAMQNMIIKRWAEDSAKEAVWNKKQILLEFSTTGDEIISPKELYEMIYQMTFDNEAKDKIKLLKEELETKGTLKDEDMEFYKKYKHKYSTIKRDSTKDEDEFTWWGDISDEELSKK